MRRTSAPRSPSSPPANGAGPMPPISTMRKSERGPVTPVAPFPDMALKSLSPREQGRAARATARSELHASPRARRKPRRSATRPKSSAQRRTPPRRFGKASPSTDALSASSALAMTPSSRHRSASIASATRRRSRWTPDPAGGLRAGRLAERPGHGVRGPSAGQSKKPPPARRPTRPESDEKREHRFGERAAEARFEPVGARLPRLLQIESDAGLIQRREGSERPTIGDRRGFDRIRRDSLGRHRNALRRDRRRTRGWRRIRGRRERAPDFCRWLARTAQRGRTTRRLGGLRALDDLDQRHAFGWREEMQSEKARRVARAPARARRSRALTCWWRGARLGAAPFDPGQDVASSVRDPRRRFR